MERALKLTRSLLNLLLLSAVGLAAVRGLGQGGTAELEGLLGVGIGGYVCWRLWSAARRLRRKDRARPAPPQLPTPAAWVTRRTESKRRKTL
jgi:hypothetical protein